MAERTTQYAYDRGRLRYNLVVLYEASVCLLLSLPRFSFFNALKSFVLRRLGARIGRRVILYPGLWIMPVRRLVVGDDVDLAYGVLITTGGGVTIGDRAMIGYRAQILSVNHMVPPRSRRLFDAGDVRAEVVIEKDSWIGAHAIILPGVRVGEGAIVAAGSVVTKDVPPFSIVAGCPARILRMRESAPDEEPSQPLSGAEARV